MSKIIEGNDFLIDLKENEKNLRFFALLELSYIVDECWHLIAERLKIMKIIFNQKNFKEKMISAFIISKIYYHLQKFELFYKYALETEEFLDIDSNNKYT